MISANQNASSEHQFENSVGLIFEIRPHRQTGQFYLLVRVWLDHILQSELQLTIELLELNCLTSAGCSMA